MICKYTEKGYVSSMEGFRLLVWNQMPKQLWLGPSRSRWGKANSWCYLLWYDTQRIRLFYYNYYKTSRLLDGAATNALPCKINMGLGQELGASPNTEWSIVKMFWPTSMSLSPRVNSTLIYTSTWASPGAPNQSQTAAKMLKSKGPPIWTSEVQQACSQQVLKPSVFSGSLKEKEPHAKVRHLGCN